MLLQNITPCLLLPLITVYIKQKQNPEASFNVTGTTKLHTQVQHLTHTYNYLACTVKMCKDFEFNCLLHVTNINKSSKMILKTHTSELQHKKFMYNVHVVVSGTNKQLNICHPWPNTSIYIYIFTLFFHSSLTYAQSGLQWLKLGDQFAYIPWKQKQKCSRKYHRLVQTKLTA